MVSPIENLDRRSEANMAIVEACKDMPTYEIIDILCAYLPLETHEQIAKIILKIYKKVV